MHFGTHAVVFATRMQLALRTCSDQCPRLPLNGKTRGQQASISAVKTDLAFQFSLQLLLHIALAWGNRSMRARLADLASLCSSCERGDSSDENIWPSLAPNPYAVPFLLSPI